MPAAETKKKMSGVKDLHEVASRWVRIYLLHVMTAEGVVASCKVKATAFYTSHT
jgi:hypothetical protein